MVEECKGLVVGFKGVEGRRNFLEKNGLKGNGRQVKRMKRLGFLREKVAFI